MKYKDIIILLIASVFLLNNCNITTNTNQHVREDLAFLEQEKPGSTPVIFAPGIISTDKYERDLAFSPDGKEIYFSRREDDKRSIMVTRLVKGAWTEPAIAPFSGTYDDIEPYIQPDGRKMFFVSKRPLDINKANKYTFNIWYMNKTKTGWSEAMPVGEPINGSGSVTYPIVTNTGNMYFSRMNDSGSEYIYISRMVKGQYTEPEKLPETINISSSQYNAYVSPSEDMLIMPVESNNINRYKISFRDTDGNWSELIDLGDLINDNMGGWSPSLSPNGKYFFFQRFTEGKNSDIYWVDAMEIKKLDK